MGWHGHVPLKPNCRLELPPDVAFCDKESNKRYEYRCYTPKVPGVWHPHVHRPCVHNAVRGLQLRTLGLNPVAGQMGVDMFAGAADELRSVLKGRVDTVLPWTHKRVVESYKVARMRTRYETAAASLVLDGLCTRKDAQVKAFVKGEKLGQGKVGKPRVIMGRNPRYNLELASYLKPLEHALYPALRGWKRMLTRTRLIGKGLNGEERASLLRKKMESGPEVCCFEVDCKSFESHLTTPMLRKEHGIYQALLPSARLAELLRWQESFDGCFRNGVRFHAEGVRASGDFNTGLGNTLIMCALVLAVGRRLKTRFDFLADGDNAVVFVKVSDLALWRRELPETFLEMGHEAEMGDVATSVSDIVFGQSKPLCVNGRWTMVRDPLKVLSNAFAGHQHYSEMRGGVKVLKSVAYCESVINRGVPLLQAFAHAMLVRLRKISFVREGFDLGNYEYQRIATQSDRWSAANFEEISSETRLLFEKSWGFSVEEQIRLEESFKVHPVGTLPTDWSQVPVADVWACAEPWETRLGV